MFKKTNFVQNWIINAEENQYAYKLNSITKFNLINSSLITNCAKITLNFGFKDFKFDKKQMVTYFFFLELISNQKCVLTTSRKNLINLRIKKGSITGCKVTLRRKSLDFFFLTLLLGLPRLEIFKGFFLKKNGEMKNSFSTKLKNLFIFYVLEFEFKNNLVAMDLTFNFNKTNNFEKCFFLTFFRMPTNYLN